MPGVPALSSNAPPRPAEVPIGLDVEDLLPCGCTEEAALFEAWAIGFGIWTQTQVTQGRTRPAVSIHLR